MKKIVLYFALGITVCFASVSCSKKSDPQPAAEVEETTPPTIDNNKAIINGNGPTSLIVTKNTSGAAYTIVGALGFSTSYVQLIFTKGKPIASGKYTVSSGDVRVLSTYGTDDYEAKSGNVFAEVTASGVRMSVNNITLVKSDNSSSIKCTAALYDGK